MRALSEKSTAVNAYRQELEALPREKIDHLVSKEIARLAKDANEKAEKEERARPFNQPSADADFGHWAKMSYWTLDECVALSLGKDPKTVNWPVIQSFERASHLASVKEHAESIKKSRQYQKELAERWCAHVDGRDSLIEQLQNRISQLESIQPADKEKTLGARERDSLVKLVIGMAIGGYGYDPESRRNSSTSEIAGDLHQNGLSLDEDTIRKYLAEGKELLPRDATEQND